MKVEDVIFAVLKVVEKLDEFPAVGGPCLINSIYFLPEIKSVL